MELVRRQEKWTEWSVLSNAVCVSSDLIKRHKLLKAKKYLEIFGLNRYDVKEQFSLYYIIWNFII
jgi:hypothetical protein